MKHIALAMAALLLAVILGQTQTHYMAAAMLAVIRADWIQQRAQDRGRPAPR